MRIASRFQRSGRSSDPRRRALAAGVWVGLISFGCFFELEPLEEPDSGIGGGGTFGAAGGVGGDAPVGGNAGSGAGGAQMFPGCNNQPGQKLCNGDCVLAGPENGCNDPSCTPCASLPNAAAPSCGIDSGRCQITSCTEGHADCDGDLLTYNRGESVVTGAAAAGCEYSFGTIAPTTQPLAVPRAQITVDDSREDWSGIPAYRVGQTCVGCEDNNVVFQPSAQNEAPPISDLDAYFRVAWDADKFYVLAEAFDDSVFNRGSSIDNGGCRTNGDYVPGPVCEDAFVLYFDGAPEAERNGNYGNAAHRIYLGTSGVSFLPAQGQPPPGQIGLRVLPEIGPRCYRMEAQFPWTLLVSNQGQTVDGKFPPNADQTYGFDMAISDFDPSVSDASVFELQSRLFWNARADQSSLASVAGVGDIVLTEHATSGDATSPQ